MGSIWRVLCVYAIWCYGVEGEARNKKRIRDTVSGSRSVPGRESCVGNRGWRGGGHYIRLKRVKVPHINKYHNHQKHHNPEYLMLALNLYLVSILYIAKSKGRARTTVGPFDRDWLHLLLISLHNWSSVSIIKSLRKKQLFSVSRQP